MCIYIDYAHDHLRLFVRAADDVPPVSSEHLSSHHTADRILNHSVMVCIDLWEIKMDI